MFVACKDFLDHQLRALILRIFENVAKKTLAMDVKDVRVTIDEWCVLRLCFRHGLSEPSVERGGDACSSSASSMLTP